MHHDVHFMAVTIERQLLPARAVRGWQAAHALAQNAPGRTLSGGGASRRGRVFQQLVTRVLGQPSIHGQTPVLPATECLSEALSLN